MPGVVGQTGSGAFRHQYGTPGGLAGFYADGNNYITWSGAGPKLGRVSGAQTQTTFPYVFINLPYLVSNTTDAQAFDPLGLAKNITTGGLSLISNSAMVNAAGSSQVAWAWTSGSPVANTDGTITSTAAVNSAAGFSIVTYTGTGVAGTVGHGLGAAPKLIIVKSKNAAANWEVYHAGVGNTYRAELNTNTAATTPSSIWNSTSPTSSVFSISGETNNNTVGSTYIAYCFAEVPGYSRFGTYTGNGSTSGPFVYCGFRPRFVLAKATSTGGAGFDWVIVDTARDAYNVEQSTLEANLTNAEASSAILDVTAAGFKLRSPAGSALNSASTTYIYVAFAELPFKYANAR